MIAAHNRVRMAVLCCAALILTACTALRHDGHAQTARLPSGAIELVEGIPIPEDLVALPGTKWLIASSMPRDGSAGRLYWIDRRTRNVHKAQFGVAPYRPSERCTPLDPARFIAHGLALAPARGNTSQRLLVVGHGGREAIELFDLDMRGDTPALQWTDCIEMPAGVEANAVAALPVGGIAFTSLYDAGDDDWGSRMAKLGDAAPAGGLYRWDGVAISQIVLPPLSGPNGVLVSEDGENIYLAGWADRRVIRIDREGRQQGAGLTLDFLPDNLRWAPDGSILVAGQAMSVEELFACTMAPDAPDYCARGVSVARIDPHTMTIVETMRRDIAAGYGDSTTAIEVDGELWLGSINGDRLAVLGED